MVSWTGQTESLCLNVLLKLSKLSDDSLLYKCMHDGIQTSYDSFHHLIWKRCPKSVFVGRKRLDVAIDDRYEAGYISLMHDSNLVLFSTCRVFGQFQCLMTIFF